LIILTIIAFSIVTGSFTNSLITGILNNFPPDLYRSKCMCGNRQLKFLENIPLLSYILLKGKCKECRNKIPTRYFITELFSVTAGLLLFWKFGPELKTLVYFILLLIFYITAIVDYKKMIIPNSLIISILILHFLFSTIKNFELINIIFALVISSLFMLVNLLYKKLWNKTAVGMGDIKYIFAAGVFISPVSLIVAIWLSSCIAILFQIIRTKELMLGTKLPFGTFLSAGFSLVLFFSNTINDLLMHMSYYE